MDLRACGVGPRTWLDVLERDFKDRALIWFGVAILVGSLVLGILGYGNFWVPDALLQLAGG
jgi:energy-coupling factor transport system permease protein